MDIIVLADNAAHARQALAPLLACEEAVGTALGAAGLRFAHDAPHQPVDESPHL